jgi:hypothetical protein
VVWGVIEMYEDRDTISLGKDVTIVVDNGDYPPIGIAGAVIAAAGLVLTVIGATTGRRSR